MATPTATCGIKELATRVIWKKEKQRWYLRVIECTNRDGLKSKRFGVSEFWQPEGSTAWYPSKTHHVYLPLQAYEALAGNGTLIKQFLPSEPKPTSSGAAAAATPKSTKDGDGHTRAVGGAVEHPAAVANQAVGRKRGRPAKRAALLPADTVIHPRSDDSADADSTCLGTGQGTGQEANQKEGGFFREGGQGREGHPGSGDDEGLEVKHDIVTL